MSNLLDLRSVYNIAVDPGLVLTPSSLEQIEDQHSYLLIKLCWRDSYGLIEHIEKPIAGVCLGPLGGQRHERVGLRETAQRAILILTGRLIFSHPFYELFMHP